MQTYLPAQSRLAKSLAQLLSSNFEDCEAFCHVFNWLADDVFRNWSSLNRHDAEDIAQDALVKLYRYISVHSDGAIGDAKSYLQRIAYNLVIEEHKRRRSAYTHLPLTDFAEFLMGGYGKSNLGANPEQALEDTVLWESVAQLPDKFRQPFLLLHREGWKVEEVAVALKITQGEVSKREQRARMLLSEHLGDPFIWITHLPSSLVPQGQKGILKGLSRGIKAKECCAAVYILQENWIIQVNQSSKNDEVWKIENDGKFKAQTYRSSRYAALLLKLGSEPPQIMDRFPPCGAEVLAITWETDDIVSDKAPLRASLEEHGGAL